MIEEGDLIRRLTDGAVCEVVEVGANFVRANVPHPTGGVYVGVSVKDYEKVVPCTCCEATGYQRA
jgi:hypothetical protein